MTFWSHFIHFVASIVIFVVLIYVGKFIINKIKSNPDLKNSRFLNPQEYFPSEGILSLKQVVYLIMILAFIIIDLYLIFDWQDGIIIISLIDIILSIYLALNLDTNTSKGKFLLFLLIPIASISRIVFGTTILVLFDIFHMFAYVYYIKVYYQKFVQYTENNGLGLTLILLFSIILVSFLFTIIAEGVSPLDSITMVSNAFTSNSFEASGKMAIGKLNSLLLAWGGFILSSVGTATLSVSLVMRYVNRQFDEIEDKIKKKNNK